jgi:O-antigen/teichoic acid export membrane protein
MGNFNYKVICSALTFSNGSHKERLRRFYSRVVSSDFTRKIVETFLTRIVLIGIGLTTSIIIARILGPEGRGLYAVAATIAALGVQFGNLGLHASNTYYVAQRPELLASLVGNTLVASFGAGSLGAIVVWGIFSKWPHLVQIEGTLLILALASIPFGLAYLLLQNLLVGIQDIHSFNKIEVGNRFLGLGLMVGVVSLGVENVEALFSTTLVALFFSFVWCFRQLKCRVSSTLSLSFSLFKTHIRYGLKAYVAAFFAFFVLRIDLLIIQYMLGAEQVGFYSIAVSVADLIYLIPTVIGTILFPKLSSMNNNEERWAYTRKVIWRIGWGMIFLSFLIVVFSKPLICLLYGKEFLPAVPALLWLTPGVVVLSMNTIFMNYFASTGMPWITVYSPALAALVNIVLNIQFIPVLGIVGASLASDIAYGVMLMASLHFLKGQRGIRFT